MENNSDAHIDLFGPEALMGLVAGGVVDFIFCFLLLTLIIPPIGLILVPFGILLHYFGAFMVGFAIFPSLKGHFLSKAVLAVAMILPLPLLAIGVLAALILKNRFVAFIAEQAAVIAATIVTIPAGGAGGAAAEAAVAGGRAAATAGARAAAAGERAAGAAARGAGTAARATEAESGGIRAGEEAGRKGLRERAQEFAERKVREKSEEILGGGGEEAPRRRADQEGEEEGAAAETAGGKEGEEIPEEYFGLQKEPLEALEEELFPEEPAIQRQKPIEKTVPERDGGKAKDKNVIIEKGTVDLRKKEEKNT